MHTLQCIHDQALPVLKALSFGEAVNITLGAPIVRTSVDHGTALDHCWKNKAKPWINQRSNKSSRSSASMNDRAHRRKLGQNYLIDPVILFEIERAINPQKNNHFFEIGPWNRRSNRSLDGSNRKVNSYGS